MGFTRLLLFVFVGAFALALPSWAAETNCTDGTDDDSDGRIDCLDGDCSRDPACRQSVTRTFEPHRTNPTDPATRWGDVYYVSWPDVPDIPDRGPAGGNACAVPGDGVIDSRDAACLILSGVDPAFTLAVVVAKFDPETCYFIGTSVVGNSSSATGGSSVFYLPPHLGLIVTLSSSMPGPALPSSTVLLEGWPDPEWTGEPVTVPNSACRPIGRVLQIPYDTLYRNSDEVLCGLQNVDWTDANGDGDPDTCPNGIFDGTSVISVLSSDEDVGLPPTGDLATNGRSISRSVLMTDKGLRFLGQPFPIRPGDALMAHARRMHQPTVWLPPRG